MCPAQLTLVVAHIKQKATVVVGATYGTCLILKCSPVSSDE